MSAYARYTKFALEYVANGKPNRHLNNSEQQTIIIYTLLNDGNWHTAEEISQKLNLKKSTVRHIMQALANPFYIASGQQGYCIPQKHTILIA
jgi:biotin operon repressor